jgi:hypothetical protein
LNNKEGPRNNSSSQKGASDIPANGVSQKVCSHHVAFLNIANDKESLHHVTSSGSYMLDNYNAMGVPECLDTFSDFYNPKISADERYEKYLVEMHRREKEVEAEEKHRIKHSSIGNFHSSKYGNKRKSNSINHKKSSSIHLPILSSSTEDFSFHHNSSINGFSDNKKALAVSTFSLHNIDKIRQKGIGIPHPTTR